MSLFDGRTPQHLGFLVDDLDTYLHLFATNLGCAVSEPEVLSIGPAELDKGLPGRLRVALAMLGTTMIEFIQPIDSDDSVWARDLARRGPGLHHVAYTLIENYDAEVASFVDKGFELTVAGHFGEDHWCYVEKDGLVLELASGVGPQFPES